MTRSATGTPQAVKDDLAAARAAMERAIQDLAAANAAYMAAHRIGSRAAYDAEPGSSTHGAQFAFEEKYGPKRVHTSLVALGCRLGLRGLFRHKVT